MKLPALESLKIAAIGGQILGLEFNHGKANEIGSGEIADLERLTEWSACQSDFLVMLMRTSAKVPYFALWVANNELMVPFSHATITP